MALIPRMYLTVGKVDGVSVNRSSHGVQMRRRKTSQSVLFFTLLRVSVRVLPRGWLLICGDVASCSVGQPVLFGLSAPVA